MRLSAVASACIATFSCRNCARTTEFEQPPCADGHGSDCPEWYCTECGAATIAVQAVIADHRANQPLARATSRS